MTAGRIRFLKGCFLLFACLIVGRALQLQLVAHPRLDRLARRQFDSKVTALPRRGVILDRNGEGLAMSLKARSLFFRPEALRRDLAPKARVRIAARISEILRMNPLELRSRMQSEKGFVWVKRQLSESEENQIRDGGFLDYGDGIGLAEETKRFYPNRELAAHVLGSVSVDGHGLEGLELLYEGILGGEEVRVRSDKDAMGRKIFQDERGLLAFKDGGSLVLTLDKGLQYEVEKNLRSAIEDYQAKSGSVIVAEVATGEILALANYPTFNPNNPKQAAADSRRNRAITDPYEPGSTFKPFIIGSLLEKGRPPKTQIYCEHGKFTVGDRTISEAEAKEKFDWLSFGEILKYSSNIGAAKAALELGPAAVGQLMERLGVGTKTDIDLPGEAAGRVDREELKKPVRLANVGFGQGFTVTPLQMLTYYLAIANGGRWVQPKIVKAVLSEDADSLDRGAVGWKLEHRFDSIKSRKIFSATVATQLKSMLEDVVQEGGTGTKAQLEQWPVAGKTGTAQKVDPQTRRYALGRYIVSFAGFAPAASPKLVALVVLSEPQRKLFAAETAAPTFREVMRASLLRNHVAPLAPPAQSQRLANQNSIEKLRDGMSAVQKSVAERELTAESGLSLERDENNQLRVPDLRGRTVREVLRLLGKERIELEIVGSGVLKEQSPAPTQWLGRGARLRLVFELPRR